MKILKKLFGGNLIPGKYRSKVLSSLLFVVFIVLYGYSSYQRLEENPQDKIMPSLGQMTKSFALAIFTPVFEDQFTDDGELIKNPNDEKIKAYCASGNIFGCWIEAYQQNRLLDILKNGKWQLWEDTKASGYRVLIAMLFIFGGVLLGLYMGMGCYTKIGLEYGKIFSWLDEIFYGFILFLDKIPAIAMLPIFFIVFGLGEPAKIAFIVMAVLPTVLLDTYLKVREIPDEQIIKGMTLGASTHENIYKIVFAQIAPKIRDTIRLNIKAIIIALIVGEALSAEAGLGYRIFLVRRYLDMATIIPYVLLISLAAFLLDYRERTVIEKKYHWLNKN